MKLGERIAAGFLGVLASVLVALFGVCILAVFLLPEFYKQQEPSALLYTGIAFFLLALLLFFWRDVLAGLIGGLASMLDNVACPFEEPRIPNVPLPPPPEPLVWHDPRASSADLDIWCKRRARYLRNKKDRGDHEEQELFELENDFKEVDESAGALVTPEDLEDRRLAELKGKGYLSIEETLELETLQERERERKREQHEIKMNEHFALRRVIKAKSLHKQYGHLRVIK